MRFSLLLSTVLLIFLGSGDRSGHSYPVKTHVSALDVFCGCASRNYKLKLRGGADELQGTDTVEVDSCSIQSILFHATEEQNVLLKLFSNLDEAQRKFYDPSLSIESWSALGDRYESALGLLTDRIIKFSEDVKNFCRKMEDKTSHWNEALPRLAHLQTLRLISITLDISSKYLMYLT
jgi:hypothetical protein